jgi:tRNA pseudouridine55 synthase
MTLFGVIPVWKPSGMTSHDVVVELRRMTGQRRVGHTGTLDPEVEGVLPICLGQATRIAEYIQNLPKRYAGSMILGVATDTQDQTGQILREEPVAHLDPSKIDEAFQQFHGEIDQVPPMVSAVRVSGRRLYEWAREGKEVPRQPRRVKIYELRRTGMEREGDRMRIDFEVLCSKGTYVRTLCADLGEWLGYPAHMSRLVRLQSGPFFLQDAVTLEELGEVAERGNWEDVLISPDAALGHLPSLIVSSSARQGVLNGMPLQLEEPLDSRAVGRLVRVYTEEGEFCALYRLSAPDTARPEKVFRNG